MHDRYVAPVTVSVSPVAPPLATGECVTVALSRISKRANACGPSIVTFAPVMMTVWFSYVVSPVMMLLSALIVAPVTSVMLFVTVVVLLRMLVATTRSTTVSPSAPAGIVIDAWYAPFTSVALTGVVALPT